jgi:hypothetical protein
MSRRSSAGFLFAALCGALVASGAHAQIFISASGKDSNSCSRTAPCRTLQRGVNATSPGRELTILTSGEYGRATINKGMTILAEGVSANVRSFASGSSAITIDAPGQKVALKGLFLTGGGPGGNGINIEAAASVHIEDCVVERFDDTGVDFSFADGAELFVSGVTSRFNGYAGLTACCDNSTLIVDRSSFIGNGAYGLTTSSVASITRSIVSGNGAAGIIVGGEANITETTAAHNGTAGFLVSAFGRLTAHSVVARGNVEAGFELQNINPPPFAIVSNSVFTHNGLGFENNGTLLTRGDNTVAENASPNEGAAPVPLAPY